MPQFPKAESPGEGGGGPALLATKPPWGIGSRKRPAIDRVPGCPRTRAGAPTQSEDTDSNPRAPGAQPGRGGRRRTAPTYLGAGQIRSSGRGEPTGQARRRVPEGRDETAPRSTHQRRCGPPSLAVRARLLSVFSFGPTSGAQSHLIVRDWKTAVPPPRAPPLAGSAHRKRARAGSAQRRVRAAGAGGEVRVASRLRVLAPSCFRISPTPLCGF